MGIPLLQPSHQISDQEKVREYVKSVVALALLAPPEKSGAMSQETVNRTVPLLALDFNEGRIEATAFDLVNVLARFHEQDVTINDLPTIPAAGD